MDASALTALPELGGDQLLALADLDSKAQQALVRDVGIPVRPQMLVDLGYRYLQQLRDHGQVIDRLAWVQNVITGGNAAHGAQCRTAAPAATTLRMWR